MIRYRTEIMCDCCGAFESNAGQNKRSMAVEFERLGWCKFPRGLWACPKCVKAGRKPTEPI